MGRFDELGSGILNINRYLKAYSGNDHPQFIEGSVFKTTILLDENLMDKVDAVNDTLNEADDGLGYIDYLLHITKRKTPKVVGENIPVNI